MLIVRNALGPKTHPQHYYYQNNSSHSAILQQWLREAEGQRESEVLLLNNWNS